MICDEARDLFSEYLRGELDYGLQSGIKDHLDACKQCRADIALLEQTWTMLDEMPMVDPPADLRHNVVVQAARIKFQQENLLKPKSALLSVIDLIIPDKQRWGMAAIAATIIFALFLKLPQTAIEHFAGGIKPAIQSSERVAPIDKNIASNTAKDRKSAWLGRRLARNTLWVSVDRRLGGNDKMLCSVTLTVNPEAFLPNVGTRRMGVKMHLLQNSGAKNRRLLTDDPIWQGAVAEGTPLMVPVILDRTGGPIDLLVTWNYGSREYSQVVFIPSTEAAVPDSSANADMGDCRNMYSFMEAVASQYGVPVVAGLPVCRRSLSAKPHGDNLKEILGSALNPAGLDWLLSDGVIYIDKALAAQE